MRRLFTFGCSFTAYGPIPTWADFLGLEFEQYENWGMSGIGNRGIAERVAECQFNPDEQKAASRTIQDLTQRQYTSNASKRFTPPSHVWPLIVRGF